MTWQILPVRHRPFTVTVWSRRVQPPAASLSRAVGYARIYRL